MITSKQRAHLRAMANTIVSVQQIGKGGIADNLIKQLDDALEAREIIKVTVLETALLTAREACEICAEKLFAEPVQCIGSKFVLYRRARNPKNRKIKI
ncbi:MAG: YhbY family RNA-binding protein [Bacillota bacterium]|nr:YhbY family RNA-binding protein [Bacillota bacterium]